MAYSNQELNQVLYFYNSTFISIVLHHVCTILSIVCLSEQCQQNILCAFMHDQFHSHFIILIFAGDFTHFIQNQYKITYSERAMGLSEWKLDALFNFVEGLVQSLFGLIL